MLRSQTTDEIEFRSLRGSVISLEAKISAGKSTLGKSMEAFLSKAGFRAKFYEEPVSEHLLNLYLSDMKKYAFSFQLVIIERRIQIHKEATLFAQSGGIAIIDRGVYGDLAFAHMQRNAGLFTDQEWSTYNAEIEDQKLDDPYIIVYLDCSTETALRRVKVRGNQSEINTYTPDYMDRLEAAHQESLKDFDGVLLHLNWEDDQPVFEHHLSQEVVRKTLKTIMVAAGISSK